MDSIVGVTRRTLVFGSILALAACADRFQNPPRPPYNLVELTYKAVDRLGQRSTPQLTPEIPIVVSSITDAQKIDQSSKFGNLIADFARSRLAQNHLTVSEQRLRSSMQFQKDDGEMMLARDRRIIVTDPMHSCILTGTYAAARSQVYVGLKLIRMDDAHIISAVDFVVLRNDDVSRLLGEAFPSRV